MRIGSSQFTKNHINLDQKISKAIRNGHATQGCLSFLGDGQIAAGSNLLDVFVKQTYKETIKGDEDNYERLCVEIKTALFEECPTQEIRSRALQEYEHKITRSYQTYFRSMVGLTPLSLDKRHDILLASGMTVGLPMPYDSLKAKPLKNVYWPCPYYNNMRFEEVRKLQASNKKQSAIKV